MYGFCHCQLSSMSSNCVAIKQNNIHPQIYNIFHFDRILPSCNVPPFHQSSYDAKTAKCNNNLHLQQHWTSSIFCNFCHSKVRSILGWAKKNESAPISVLAWAHMRMGIENYHTDFGDIWSSQSSAIYCQPKGVPWWPREGPSGCQNFLQTKFYYNYGPSWTFSILWKKNCLLVKILTLLSNSHPLGTNLPSLYGSKKSKHMLLLALQF